MTQTNVEQLYRRRLATLLFGQTFRDYDEDWNSRQVSFILVGPAQLDHLTVARIRRLFNAELVTLTAVKNSLKVVIHEVAFPMIH